MDRPSSPSVRRSNPQLGLRPPSKVSTGLRRESVSYRASLNPIQFYQRIPIKNERHKTNIVHVKFIKKSIKKDTIKLIQINLTNLKKKPFQNY